MDCLGIGRILTVVVSHQPESSSLYRLWFCRNLVTYRQTTYEREAAELQKKLQQRILELKSQATENKRNSYRSRAARHSLEKLKMEVSKLKEQEKNATRSQSSGNVPSFLSLEVLSNGTAQSNPSCFIRTPFKTYLFNCPEGSTRLMASLRIKPNQINDIFITSAVWDNFGGMNSFLMSRENKGESLRVHSSVGIRDYFDCIRPFADSDVGHIKYPVQVDERSLHDDFYEDAAVKVHYIPLRAPEDSSPVDCGRSPLPRSSFKNILRTDVAFLVELLQPPRRINALKLLELGIPNGPHIAALKDGHEVKLDGRVIRPDDVLFPLELVPQPTVLIVECSGPGFFPSLRDNLLLQEFIGGGRSLNFCVHFTPAEMFSNTEYTEWMNKFGQQCKHIVLNGTGPKLPHIEGVYRQQLLFRSFAPFLFPSLTPDVRGILGQDDECKQVGNVFFVRPLQRFILRGKTSVADPIVCNLTETEYTARDLSESAISQIEAFKKITESVDTSDSSSPALIFLGTASATPTKYRNVSGVVLKVNNDSYIMVDCGEGTYGQMRVLFGDTNCADVLVKLHAILITHAHTDHVNGLYTILMKRKAAFEAKGLKFEKIVLICCPNVMRILEMYCRAFSDLHPMVDLVSCLRRQTSKLGTGDAKTSAPVNHNELTFDITDSLPSHLYDENKWGVKSIKLVRVHHTRLANGYVVTLTNGRKFVFSGDTKPCQLLVEQGRGADVLVHEATFEDFREEDALGKKHSTMWQAVDVGRRMNAKYIILTHFSSRYAKVPALPSYLDRYGNIAVAYDNLFVPLKQMSFLPKLIPVCRELFKDELFEMETRIHQQRLKEEYSYDMDDETAKNNDNGRYKFCAFPASKSTSSRKRKASDELTA